MESLDNHLLRGINGWPDSISPFLTFFSVALNLVWVKCVLGLLLVGMVIANKVTRATAIQAIVAVVFANGLTDVLKWSAHMHRPYQDLLGIVNRVPTTNSYGTASAHAANMAAVALVFCFRLHWWGTPWVVIAILTGLSRVYVGAHYPYQVLLGWSCGLTVSLLVVLVWDIIQTKRTPVLVEETSDAASKTG